MKNILKKNKYWVLVFVVSVCLITLLLLTNLSSVQEPIETTYLEFVDKVEKGVVERVVIDLQTESSFVFFTFNSEDTFVTSNPKYDDFKLYLLENNIQVDEIQSSSGFWGNVLMSFIPLLFFIFIIIYMFKKMGYNRAKESFVTVVPKINFDNIAGHKELKKDLEFVVKYLKDPKKYTEIGAKTPNGIVLYGPPGTGKTLTARAIAGTAGVNFFSVSGSDFVEMFVGLGAKRIRDLYAQARKMTPCIVFIDEIDAVGSQRGMSGNSEKDQTINALLNELDGFTGKEGVMTICATNRVEDLDHALIRPGRFDKHLAVPLPEKEERLEILRVHARGKAIDPQVDFEELASTTVGFSGAALESLLNESAFIAVNEGSQTIKKEHIDSAFYKIVVKGNKRSALKKDNRKDIEIAAYHEAGHALASKLLTEDNVPKVSIIPSTSGSGGMTFRTPRETNYYSKAYVKNTIKVMYAGRAAEVLYFKDKDLITTGASEDIKVATKLIKEYLTIYCMDDNWGMINLESLSKNKSDYSNELLSEARKISKSLFFDTLSFVEENFDTIKKIAEVLVKKETITGKELEKIISSCGKETIC